jgi:putative oxidoreductase
VAAGITRWIGGSGRNFDASGLQEDQMIDETAATIDESRLVIPGLAGFYRRAAPYSYAFIRILVGLLFLPIGIDKLFLGGAGRIAAGNILRLGVQPPLAWAWTVAGLEFFGAFLLMLGLFTRPVAFALAIELTVITSGILAPRGWLWTVNGFEVGLLLTLVLIGLVFGGSGRYSLDRLIGREF